MEELASKNDLCMRYTLLIGCTYSGASSRPKGGLVSSLWRGKRFESSKIVTMEATFLVDLSRRLVMEALKILSAA